MEPDLKFEIAINRMCPGEKLPQGDPRWYRFTRSFHQETHTLDSLLAEIQQGHSFAPVVKGGHRKQENYISAQHIGLDSDTGDQRSALEVLAEDPFIGRHAALLYETHSSTPESLKARILFLLERPYSNPLEYRTLQQALAWRYGFTDPSVAEQSRFFYGAVNCRVLKLGQVLREKVVEREVVLPYLDHLADQAESQKRNLPATTKTRVVGATNAERYVNRAIQEEASWVATRQECTGERHQGLLVAAMKLASLRLSEWLPEEVRLTIDPCAVLLPAAEANGYLSKYGETATRQTIADGVAYARPRPNPDSVTPTRPRLRYSGGQWVKAVRA